MYHLGRLLSYLILGSLAGLLGKEVFQSEIFKILPWIMTAAISLGFVWMGIMVWKGQAPHLFKLPNRFLSKLYAASSYGPFSIGTFSALLPCGWLHTFVLGAVTTGSAVKGALYLFCFWVGTLPALSAVNLTVKHLFGRIRSVPRIAALLLIAVGVANLGIKIMNIVPGADPAASCHHEHHHHASQ